MKNEAVIHERIKEIEVLFTKTQFPELYETEQCELTTLLWVLEDED